MILDFSGSKSSKFRAVHKKDSDERIEIRFDTNGGQTLVIVYKKEKKKLWKTDNFGNEFYMYHHGEIQISSNGKVQLSFDDWRDMCEAVEEAKDILRS